MGTCIRRRRKLGKLNGKETMLLKYMHWAEEKAREVERVEENVEQA